MIICELYRRSATAVNVELKEFGAHRAPLQIVMRVCLAPECIGWKARPLLRIRYGSKTMEILAEGANIRPQSRV
jgi:hypothetical protein